MEIPIFGEDISTIKFTNLFKKIKNLIKFLNNQKLFELRKLFIKPNFSNTHYISEYLDTKIFRISKKHFKNNLIQKKIKKISIKNKTIRIHTNQEKSKQKN